MTVAVGVGLSEYPFEDAGSYWRWVDMCEAEGVDSIWQTDRLVGPAPFLEAMSTMAALAGRTKRVRFGMNVLSLAFRDPVLVAKQCATIDFLSGGRLLPAFGIGSPIAPEWRMLNLSTKTRGRKTDEAIDIIGRLWREDGVSYAGRHFNLTDVTIMPKPVQAELPVWIGGGSPAAIRRTARVGTGWISGPETPATIGPVIDGIKAQLAEFGRAIDHDHFGAIVPFYFGRPTDTILGPAFEAYRKRSGNEPLDYFAIGDADDVVRRIAQYVDAGASKFVLRPVTPDGKDVLAQTRRLIDEVIPAVDARFGHLP